MTTQTIRIFSLLGKLTGLFITLVVPFSVVPVGLIIFAAASFAKDAVRLIHEFEDEGGPDDSLTL